MDDQHARRTTPRGFLIFVGPAAIIGHGIAAEVAFAALEVGVVDEHDDDLACDIDILEVGPVPLGRVGAVSGEHQRRIVELDLCLAVDGRAHREILLLHHLDALVAKVEIEHRIIDHRRAGQHDVLRPFARAVGAHVAARLEPCRGHRS